MKRIMKAQVLTTETLAEELDGVVAKEDELLSRFAKNDQPEIKGAMDEMIDHILQIFCPKEALEGVLNYKKAKLAEELRNIINEFMEANVDMDNKSVRVAILMAMLETGIDEAKEKGEEVFMFETPFGDFEIHGIQTPPKEALPALARALDDILVQEVEKLDGELDA